MLDVGLDEGVSARKEEGGVIGLVSQEMCGINRSIERFVQYEDLIDRQRSCVIFAENYQKITIGS